MMALELNKFNVAALSPVVSSFLPPIVAAGFVIAIAYSLSTITWSFIPGAGDQAPPEIKASPVVPTARQNNQVVGSQISNWHLFGIVTMEIPKTVVVAPPPEVKEAPDTQLHLVLKGVVASRDMLDAWAIIADRSGEEDNYSIDSEVPGGATLKEIYPDRVILLHNGRYETLRLPKESLDDSNLEPRQRAVRNSNIRRSSTSSSSSSSSNRIPSGNITQVSPQATQALKEYRQKLVTDPQSVMNTVRAEPYRQGGELKGYRIFPGKDKELFNQIGLQPGDVVVAINGIALDSPLKGLEVMQNVTDATEVNMEVIRNGVSQTFSVPLN